MRPVTWVIYLSKLGIIVIVSPFEANELVPIFRSSKASSRIHMLSSGRRSADKGLFGDVALTLPRRTNITSIIPDASLLVQLRTFAGHLYLNDDNQIRAFRSFLGLHVRTSDDESYCIAASRGWLEDNGWIRATRRKLLHLPEGSFEKSPLEFVRRLIELRCRGERVPRFSDTYSIVTRGKLMRDRSE